MSTQIRSAVNALGPLDGRYALNLTAMAEIFSEYGLIRRRVEVEVAWFIGLSRLELKEFPPLSADAIEFLKALVKNFSAVDADAVKEIEKTTNHDVKAVEYWLKRQFEAKPELQAVKEFVHFACTSEDINNVSHALQLEAAREDVILPALDELINKLRKMAHFYSGVPMVSRTHGQLASPTTMGKEIANVVARLKKAYGQIEHVQLMAKMNGAVGNYNAHRAAYPKVKWESFSKTIVEVELGLTFQPYSIQIEPHDYMAELFDAVARTNTILIDFARDVWGYVSLGYFKQRLKEGEVGSSTMPHKINPINFENAEGNLGLSNALLRHLSEKLPISRFQRDLTDSTVLRNMGTALGYAVLAYQSLMTGLSKLELNEAAIAADINDAWELVAEPIQMILRAAGFSGAYEALAELTKGQVVTSETIRRFIAGLPVPDEVKAKLFALTPQSYIGLAFELASRV